MTFDTRARRAVQGIHRAVEEMEMSSTKTPQRLTRFDQYREGKSRNKRIAALAVGIAVPLVLLIVALLVLGPDRDSERTHHDTNGVGYADLGERQYAPVQVAVHLLGAPELGALG